MVIKKNWRLFVQNKIQKAGKIKRKKGALFRLKLDNGKIIIISSVFSFFMKYIYFSNPCFKEPSEYQLRFCSEKFPLQRFFYYPTAIMQSSERGGIFPDRPSDLRVCGCYPDNRPSFESSGHFSSRVHFLC